MPYSDGGISTEITLFPGSIAQCTSIADAMVERPRRINYNVDAYCFEVDSSK